jgi:hypothetical protein
MDDQALHNLRPGRRVIPVALLLVLVVASGVAAWTSSVSSRPSSSPGPEGVVVDNVPDVASANSTLAGSPVDGITCRTEADEVVKCHIHTYVSVYVNGHQQRLPAGIGITKPSTIEHYNNGPFYDVGLYNCLYWLHTHVNDGVIHVEAPVKSSFTLGQFFDIWGRPISATQVGPDRGAVTVFENGQRLSGDPRSTPLLAYGVIQIDVGSPFVAFHRVYFKVSGGCGQGALSCSTNTTTSQLAEL